MNDRRYTREQEDAKSSRIRHFVDGGWHRASGDDSRSDGHPDRRIGAERRAVNLDPGRASSVASHPARLPLLASDKYSTGREDEETLDRGFGPLREGSIFGGRRRKRGYLS